MPSGGLFQMDKVATSYITRLGKARINDLTFTAQTLRYVSCGWDPQGTSTTTNDGFWWVGRQEKKLRALDSLLTHHKDMTAGSGGISSLGLPGSVMSSKKLDGGYVAFMEEATTASADGAEWELGNSDSNPAPNTLTLDSAPTSASHAPSRASKSSTTAPESTIAAKNTPSSSDLQPTGPTPSGKPIPTSSKSVTPGGAFMATSGSSFPAATTSPSAEAETGKNSQPDGGDIAGIVTGTVGALAAVLALFFAPATILRWVTCGRRRTKRTNKEMRVQMTGTMSETVTKTFRTSLAPVRRVSQSAGRG